MGFEPAWQRYIASQKPNALPTELSGCPTELSGHPTELSGRPTELSGCPTELSISLTLSLSPQFVIYISTSKANTLFLLKKCGKIFNKKEQCICNIAIWNFNESLTNNIVNFEQLGPDDLSFELHC